MSTSSMARPAQQDSTSATIAEAESYGIVPGLLWGFRIHDDGKADPLAADQPVSRRHDGWLWLHFDLSNLRAVEWIQQSEIPGPAIASMISRDRHQEIHTMATCIYGVLADHVRRIDGVGEDVAHLRFAMTERLLISGRHHALAAVEAARGTLQGGAKRLPHVGALLELIVEHVADAIDRVTDDLASDLDHIEDCLARRIDEFERQKLTAVRRATVRLHRQLAGMRTVFHRLERRDTEDVLPALRFASAKLAQRLDSLDHDILEMRERGHRLQEEISALMAEETNRHLYVLSILTTLFLPPTLVTGIFGMNTKGLPLTDVEGGFIWAMALLLSSSLAVYLVMRRIGVFKTK